jgi:type I restriction enzyme, S subunit
LGFRTAEAKTLPTETEAHQDAAVNRGDVVISRSNTAERVGLVAYVEANPGRRLLSDLTWKLVPAPGVDPRYLAYALSWSGARRAIARAASGTSGSMKKLNRSKLRAVEIPLPEPAEQRAVAELIDAARVLTGQSAAATARLRSLRGAALTALLSGRHEIPQSYDRFVEHAERADGEKSLAAVVA